MDSHPLRVLLVDDDEDDYVLTRGLLAAIEGGAGHVLDWVSTYEEGLEAIGQRAHDVYLLDYRLGERTGLELLREAVAAGCRSPLILMTGQGDREVDVEAMRAGATDYLVKGSVDAPLLERSLRYAVERNKVDQLKDSLLAFASHELRTPLTAVRGYAETLLLQDGEELGGLTVELLGCIIQASDHLTRLIDGFLDISRVDAGRPIELVREDFDLRGMVEEAIEIQRMAARRCDFAAQYGPGVGTARGDRYKLMLVLINLLSNADKYSPDGGVVLVEVDAEDEATRFTVTDHGTGMPAEALEHVFTPFYRLLEPRHREVRGTGLGLCLCRHLVEAHGGRIWITSEVGRGTRVQFTVPT